MIIKSWIAPVNTFRTLYSCVGPCGCVTYAGLCPSRGSKGQGPCWVGKCQQRGPASPRRAVGGHSRGGEWKAQCLCVVVESASSALESWAQLHGARPQANHMVSYFSINRTDEFIPFNLTSIFEDLLFWRLYLVMVTHCFPVESQEDRKQTSRLEDDASGFHKCKSGPQWLLQGVNGGKYQPQKICARFHQPLGRVSLCI